MTKFPDADRDDKTRDAKASGPSRRGLLGALALTGALAAEPAGAGPGRKQPGRLSPRDLDRRLTETIDTVVVIYAENRSFNNLFADFPGLQRPLADLPPEKAVQRDRDGKVLERLPPIWGGMVQHEQVVEHSRYQIGEKDLPPQANAPFALSTPQGDPLPHGVVTRDLVHEFYRNQMQINGGANDGFVAWGDSGALVMGHYADASVNLRLWRLAEQYTLCDNFFMGAFGGSFLNHQYLVAAQPPFYPDAENSPATVVIAEIEGDPKGARLKPLVDSPASAMDGLPKFGSTTLTPDHWAVNTMAPPYWPSWGRDKTNPALADLSQPMTLVAQTHAHIGDRLAAKGIDWAWYAGAWGAAQAGGKDDEVMFPARPNFQVHHQPFNYFTGLAPGKPERDKRLRDGGLGDSPRTNHFLADAAAGRLPAVTFYKPQGDLNMHAGYSDVDAGDRHIARCVDALKTGPQWEKMLVVITFDENGGWWDHVAPPKGGRWGPGTRIPALIVSPHAKKGFVDHTIYDTGSIQRFLNRRFGLVPLPGVVERDAAMRAAGGPAPGDLTAALDLA